MILSTFSHLIEKKKAFLITYNKKASKHQIIYKKTTTRTMTEDNKAIDLYINEDIFSHILKIINIKSNDEDLLVKRLPYSQSYDHIDKIFDEQIINKNIVIFYSFANSNNQKHISQIIQSERIHKQFTQLNHLYNYDYYSTTDELLKIQKKENIPILVTIFVNNHYQDQKEIETKLVNNLYFNKN